MHEGTDIVEELRSILKGEVEDRTEVLQTYSHDASVFEVFPKAVVYPQNATDLGMLVRYVSDHKGENPGLSITPRGAGSDMSGGAINDSIVVDFTRHFTRVGEITPEQATVQPGVFYRDFEPKTLAIQRLMPTYPASKDLATVGGIVANDAGGEKSLEYGKTERWVKRLKAVMADGNEYEFGPLDATQLKKKMSQQNFEGELYRKMYNLLEKHYEMVRAAKPKVNKNSTGYKLWDVWDRERQVFNLAKLLVGSQGTLGLITEIEFELVPTRPYSGLLVAFMPNLDKLGEIINTVLPHKPATFESFDDVTLELSIKFMPYFAKTLGWWGVCKLVFSLLPDLLLLRHGVPKLILMIEFDGQTQEEVNHKIDEMRAALRPYGLPMERDETAAKSKKFWVMRRESFNLLRKKVKDKHAAPFIDDLVVPPQHLPEFLPKLRALIKKYDLFATVAGHIGDGNFHIIPLMKLEEPGERAKLYPAMREANELVLQYGGVLAGEHNDGLIRGYWLERAYGTEVFHLFLEAKHIFDPWGIFNPHKKANATWEWSRQHLRESF